MLCLSSLLANLWSWIRGEEQNASCDLSYHRDDNTGVDDKVDKKNKK